MYKLSPGDVHDMEQRNIKSIRYVRNDLKQHRDTSVCQYEDRINNQTILNCSVLNRPVMSDMACKHPPNHYN